MLTILSLIIVLYTVSISYALNIGIRRVNVVNNNNNHYYHNNNNIRGINSILMSSSSSVTDASFTSIDSDNNSNINDNKTLIKKIYTRASDYINKTRLMGMYGLSLNLKPLSTKSISSMIGFIIGDFIAQLISRKVKYDLIRSLRIGAFGALIHGPCGHVFFSLLEKNLPGANVGIVTLKVIIDQLVWSPLFAALLISFVGITSGSAPFQIYKMITISLKPLILTSWAIWPLAHYFNFRIIPTKYRLVYTNIVQLIYNVIACYTVNRYI